MKEKDYKIPKSYKKIQIAIIPEDWEVKRLDEILKYTQSTGYMLKKIEYLEDRRFEKFEM